MPTSEITPTLAENTVGSASQPKLSASVGKNTIFGVIAGGTQVATRLITIPIVIAHLGLGGYGIWSIIMTTAAYMRFGTVGIKSAFQKYVAEATGTGDYAKASQLLSTGCTAIFTLSVVGLIPIAIFSRVLAKAAGVPPEFVKATSGSISVLALIMVMSSVGAVFEAIVMGGHRIDLARRFVIVLTIAEAIAIVALLHFGHSLLAMASVMGLSELALVVCCFLASRRVLPQIHVTLTNFDKGSLRELFRFAGSYQLVSILQVLYAAILPITMLRAFGVNFAGIYALSLRLISPAQMLQDSFLLSILSGGAMVYASGQMDRMENLLHKSFKVTLTFAILPLSFIACFGAPIIFAWTGQNAPQFRVALALVALAGAFQAVSVLGLVLYRISGSALLDNLRQVLVIVTLLTATLFAQKLGFYGVLGGLAFAEMLGMIFMIYAVAKTFHVFRPATFVADAAKMFAVAAGMLAAGAVVNFIPLPIAGPRLFAAVRATTVFTACVLVLWPLLRITGFATAADGRTILGLFSRRSSTATTSDPALQPVT
jgi:O-antigen/teichoic acid export membrane protein